ncbi:DUF4019 domain-containing protein [Paraburkholderia sp.]|uniref:DUF4019 domain-containing protein n=1 Tax=Paraburkholderia sp. TaxID=1926495 RepID=UPI003D6EB7F3
MKIGTLTKTAATLLLMSVATLAMAAPGASADELLRDADAVLQQIDAAHEGALWDNAAPFVKTKIQKPLFVTQLQQARQSLGTIATRGWASVMRLQYTNNHDVPDGLYANVDYASHTADGQTVFELVSFRLESDSQWHLTGYNVRRTQQLNPAVQQSVPKP